MNLLRFLDIIYLPNTDPNNDPVNIPGNLFDTESIIVLVLTGLTLLFTILFVIYKIKQIKLRTEAHE